MSVFISYSRKDEDFVDELSKRLIKKGIKVWRDNFEMVVGYSLDQIQKAIEERSSFMLIVLSNNSLESSWCQVEMEIGLKLEEELGEVFVLPILLENCSVPELIANKLFADLSNSFEEGLSELIKPLSRLYSKYIGRIQAKGSMYYIDHSIEIEEFDGRFCMTIDAVQFHEERSYSVLVQTFVVGDEAASKRWIAQRMQGKEFVMPIAFINTLRDDPNFNQLQMLIIEEEAFRKRINVVDEKSGITFYVSIRARLLGHNNTFDVVFDYGSVIEKIALQLS